MLDFFRNGGNGQWLLVVIAVVGVAYLIYRGYKKNRDDQ